MPSFKLFKWGLIFCSIQKKQVIYGPLLQLGVKIASYCITNYCTMPNYLLSISNDEALMVSIIHDPKTKLKIRVYDTELTAFNSNEAEVRFFVTSSTRIISFETSGYKKHRELLILHMISWYCVYLGLDDAKIHTNWPEYTDAVKVV